MPLKISRVLRKIVKLFHSRFPCGSEGSGLPNKKFYYPYRLYQCRAPAGIYATGKKIPISIVCMHRRLEWKPDSTHRYMAIITMPSQMTLNNLLLPVNLGWPGEERAKQQLVSINITLTFETPPAAC